MAQTDDNKRSKQSKREEHRESLKRLHEERKQAHADAIAHLRKRRKTYPRPRGRVLDVSQSQTQKADEAADASEQRSHLSIDSNQSFEGVAADNTEDSAEVMKSTVTMSMCTLLSRVTGFVRTWACAFALGNTLLSSAYQVANNMPNMVYELVAGGILTTAFLPVYISQLKKRGEEGAGDFAGNLMSIAFILLGIVTLLCTIFAPQVIFTQTFMTNGQDAEQAVFFFRFFAIQMMFYGMGAIVSGILNAHKHYLWPAIGPVFNNIVVIAATFAYVFINPSDPELAKVVLAVGTSLGVLVMMCVQIPALVKLKVPIRIHIDLHDPAIKETLKLALPATIFVVINIVVVSVRTAFALNVADNGPSTLSYAWLWYQFPYGVLAVALSTAMLTEMSSAAASKDWPLFRRNVKSGLSGTMFLIIPMSIVMFFLAAELTSLYHAGQFTAEDVLVVTEVLRWWCVSLPFYAGYMYMYRAFSAMQDLGKVTWLDGCGRIVQAAMYAGFTMGGMGIVGIPVADTIFYAVMFFVLCALMRKRVGNYGFAQALSTSVRSVIASAVGIVAIGILYAPLSAVIPDDGTIFISFVYIIILGVIVIAVFYGMARLLRVPEASLIDGALRKVRRKVFRRG